MSRIPIPAHNSSHGSPVAARNFSPVPFPPEQRDSARSTSMSALSSQGFPTSVSETRKKQSKRDEAIRKKIESELSRKRTISTTNSMRGNKRGSRIAAAKGTVAALRPSPALTVPENITVSEASQLCAAKRTDCVLVVDDEEGLSGIFTAKDMAYRVTADGLDPHTTPVHQIMTRNPMVTRDTTSATEALQLMVSKHFRHLPVCNEEGNVVGLLDITKVFHEALGKVERSSAASEQLFAAMAGVQSELGSAGSNPQAAAMLAWAEKLREKTALPDLTTVMDVRSHPATVGPKTTVREAARLMKERRVTAVCVMESVNPSTPGLGPGMGPSEKIAGIFTSKDVVLRVIAAGLDAGRCSVVRVMTPHPDTAPPTMSVHDALKKMHNGHYLNLPVVEEDGHLSAIIDVLTLTYATLEQMNAMTTGDNNTSEGEGGPMWGRFFDSIGNDDNDSYVSGSRATPDMHSLTSMHNLHPPQSPQSEVHPNDSASVMDDEPSAMGYPHHPGVPSITGMVPPVDDGTYVFKFRTPSGRTHRFQARHDSVEHLREVVAGKLATDPFFTDFKSTSDPAVIPDPIDFHLSYTDTDGDSVFVTSDQDVVDAVKTARSSGADRVVLVIHGGKGWSHGDAKEATPEPKPEPVPEVPSPAMLEAEKVKSVLLEGNAIPPQQIPEEIMGIPKDILLPASIVTLAVAIIGVFAVSRFSSRY
ncbi:CBS-domain-containing protein [Mycena capillaripes]|nr:CBS-domain-containing protein [Mycena capillaripes]